MRVVTFPMAATIDDLMQRTDNDCTRLYHSSGGLTTRGALSWLDSIMPLLCARLPAARDLSVAFRAVLARHPADRQLDHFLVMSTAALTTIAWNVNGRRWAIGKQSDGNALVTHIAGKRVAMPVFFATYERCDM